MAEHTHSERGEQGDIGHIGPQGERGLTGKSGTTPLIVRYATAAYVFLMTGMALAVLLFFSDYRKDEVARRATLEARRGDLIIGCERQNEIRQALIDVINTAYRFRPIPDSATTREVDTLTLANVLREEERLKQLAHKGLIMINCEEAYPLRNFR